MLDAVASTAENPIPTGLAPWFLFARGCRGEPERDPQGPDEALWRLVAGGAGTWRTALTQTVESDPAPMHPPDARTAIEVWTERDLSALHAASRLRPPALDDDLHRRIETALTWHHQFTEPDNATGRPWAIHLSALRSITTGDAGAGLYAETQLHNCQVLTAAPDALSAEILRDAADALRAYASGESGSH